MTSAPLLVGIAGLGTAGQAFIPALRAHPGWRLAAFAEPDRATRDAMAEAHGVAGYATLDAMLAHPGLDAVCLATPTGLHAEGAIAALGAGKHVVVEKPMAITLGEAHAMVAAADRAGRVLLVGHSHSYDEPIRRMRALIGTGELGRPRMVHTWNFTDWVYRPRRADELLTAEGGGVTYRQGAHQFDIVRLLAGGRAETVRARTFDWDPDRSVVGAHTVMVDFADGATATVVYNGYGGLSGSELCGGVGEWGFPQTVLREGEALPSEPADPAEAKRRRALRADRAGAPHHPHFGLTVVSCEGGDIRQSPGGLAVYTRRGRRDLTWPAGRSPYEDVVAEFHDAATGRAPALHDGRWGLANLELCVAAIRSAETGREVRLQHQVGLPEGRSGPPAGGAGPRALAETA